MLNTAIAAARSAGKILRSHFGKSLSVDEQMRHDIKLEVDRLCEEAICTTIRGAFPDDAILGEERGEEGNAARRWIVDPLDGTMNFFYNIPHFATSIALEIDGKPAAGVVYDPMRDELFSAAAGEGARLNGKPVSVSKISDPAQAVVVCGFMKDDETIRTGLDAFSKAIFRVRKVRCTGSAALDLAYVAAGRFTAYYEAGIKHWDIAAGRVLLLEAGGRIDAPHLGEGTFNVFASNGGVHEELSDIFRV